MSRPRLAGVLADPTGLPLTIGREAATELGLEALEHLEGRPAEGDLRAMAVYAARHDDSSPARDALAAILLNASGTLPGDLADAAVTEIRRVNGEGMATPPLPVERDLSAVPRRQALAERLLAERARRLRPRMHAVVSAILVGGEQPSVPTWFLERNWLDLRDTLVQRVKNEPIHREAIARWLAAQPAGVFARLQAVEDALVDVTTQAILYTPERAPLAPYCGEERVVDAVRSAANFRGEPQRVRLRTYLSRLTPGTPWYDTIARIAQAQDTPR